MKLYKFSILLVGVLLITVLMSIIPEGRNDVIELDSHRELFVDHFLIDKLDGTNLVMHNPHDEGEVLQFDKPWEGPFCAYVTVIKDEETYRLYYRGIPTAGKDGNSDEVTCYAESKDGIHWEKPDLGIFKVNGTTRNNVILANAAPVTHNFSPFKDMNPDVASQYLYKALGGTGSNGLIAWVSQDGIHWKKLQEKAVITEGAFDSQNVSFWSEKEKKYLCYFRTWRKVGDGGYRSVSRTTSMDFIHWTKPVQMEFGDTPLEHLYTNQTAPYFRAPHIYVSVAARFMPGRQVLTKSHAQELGVNPKYFKDCSDAIFMTSRGGIVYNRTFMEAFIPPGIGLQNWVSRTNYPALNVVQTGPDEMSVYVNQNYAQPTANLHRYSLRLDGFVSVTAPYKGGEMITKPFTFKGSMLQVNFNTSAAGSILVEVMDKEGRPLPGYSMKEAQPLIGNEISRNVYWNGDAGLKALEGKFIRLRFVMKDAHLYSIKFD